MIDSKEWRNAALPQVFNRKHDASLTQEAYHRLEEIIVTAEFKPGTIVTEKEVSDYLGIGRTPVREAFKKLESTHLVSFLPRKGILIRVVSVDELLMQMEPRSVLEQLRAERAARYATPGEREQLRNLARQYRTITDTWAPAVEALRVDDAFNRLACQCTRNPFLADALLPMYPMARRQYYLNYFIDKQLTRKVNYSHAALMEAIADGDVEQALRVEFELLANVREFNSLSLATWFPDLGHKLRLP